TCAGPAPDLRRTCAGPAIVIGSGSGLEAAAREVAGEAQGGPEAAAFGTTRGGRVVGDAVIGRGAGDGEAQGGVHGLVEVDELHRDERLVVVAADDHVEAALTDGRGGGGAEHRV